MNQKTNKRSNERKIFWADKIKEWENSNMQQSEFCKQNNLDQQQFSKWKNRLKKSNNLVEVKTGIPLHNKLEENIELIVKDKYKIKITPDFNAESLKKILSILGDEK